MTTPAQDNTARYLASDNAFTLALLSTVAAFAVEWPECFEGHEIHDRCMEISEAFMVMCAENGLDEAHTICGFKMDAADGFFLVNAGHFAVQVRDLVLDWTYRQFNPDAPVPRVTTLAEWREEWSTLGPVSRVGTPVQNPNP